MRKLKSIRRDRARETAAAYAFLAPELLLLLLFVFVPMIYAFRLSFTDWNGYAQIKNFIGLGNYETLLREAAFWASVRITAVYTVGYVALLVAVSLALALLNNAVLGRAGQFYRSFIFAPHAVSLIVAGIVWAFIFHNQKGLLNQALRAVGLPRQLFLASRSQALYCVMVMSLWISCGYYMILFLAALKDIPRSQYEAASIDGAGAMTKFVYITLPGIKDTSLFVFVVSTIGALQLFEPIQVITHGGPAQSTYVVVKYIYDTAFWLQRMGKASAAAFILFLIILVLTLIQLKLSRMED